MGHYVGILASHVCLQLVASIYAVPTADAVATGKVNSSTALRRPPANGMLRAITPGL